jgi:hypothetical protein
LLKLFPDAPDAAKHCEGRMFRRAIGDEGISGEMLHFDGRGLPNPFDWIKVPFEIAGCAMKAATQLTNELSKAVLHGKMSKISRALWVTCTRPWISCELKVMPNTVQLQAQSARDLDRLPIRIILTSCKSRVRQPPRQRQVSLRLCSPAHRRCLQGPQALHRRSLLQVQ